MTISTSKTFAKSTAFSNVNAVVRHCLAADRNEALRAAMRRLTDLEQLAIAPDALTTELAELRESVAWAL